MKELGCWPIVRDTIYARGRWLLTHLHMTADLHPDEEFVKQK